MKDMHGRRQSDCANASDRLSRRRFVAAAASGLAALAVNGCRPNAAAEMATERSSDTTIRTSRTPKARLAARPVAPTKKVTPGLQSLGLARERDALLYVPAGHVAERAAPLAVMLHGAGGTAEQGMSLVRGLADAAGLVVLAPASRQQTWDVIRGAYGPDIEFLDAALHATFERCAIDPRRLAVGGFSDGASYALSVGLTNGDLFTHIVAFSPGFMSPADQVGTPRCWVSHGTRDAVLPIDRCSRLLVPELRRAGYDVRYQEFDGPHTVPPNLAREAVDWLTASPG
jgi:phospholipase/carboxylesterase